MKTIDVTLSVVLFLLTIGASASCKPRSFNAQSKAVAVTDCKPPPGNDKFTTVSTGGNSMS